MRLGCTNSSVSFVQRTNLDVNLAVNNLLSRDDEDGDDNDDGAGGSDSYVPDDLISLLDGGISVGSAGGAGAAAGAAGAWG